MEEKFTATFEEDGRGLLFVGRGVLSGEAMIRQTRKTYSSEVLGRLCYQIIDLREVERMDITSGQMQRLAELDRQAAEAASGARIAIVAAHDLTIGLSRIYSAYAQSPHLESRIFPTMEEARAWVSAC